ncbi:MAG: ribosome maturation factor RimM [Actinomycetota bacterium]|nr:ribosome maturation factor RimM [Actinomycetota bacterium]
MDLLDVGRIDKPHGLRGEVIVSLTTDRAERVRPGAVLHAMAGPLTVESSRPHQRRFIVRFGGVDTREAAEALHGQALRAEPLEDPDALWVHDLVGAQVVTKDARTWGRVVAVLANPAHDLLELESGVLVPVVFVIDDTGLPDRLVIDPPAGLLED